MRIYTRTGDRGETALFGGTRVRKDNARVEAYGSVDELNAALGLARAQPGIDQELDGCLAALQAELFHLGADLASPGARTSLPRMGVSQVASLEAVIDRFEARLPKLESFILPGGCQVAAALHLARTICRRAERRCVTLAGEEPVAAPAVTYLNRLSDLLFVLARAANQSAGVADVLWDPRSTAH